MQDLASEGSYGALSAHQWQLRALQSSNFEQRQGAGHGGTAPVQGWARELLRMPLQQQASACSAASDGKAAQITVEQWRPLNGTFAKQLHALARALMFVLEVRCFFSMQMQHVIMTLSFHGQRCKHLDIPMS